MPVKVAATEGDMGVRSIPDSPAPGRVVVLVGRGGGAFPAGLANGLRPSGGGGGGVRPNKEPAVGVVEPSLVVPVAAAAPGAAVVPGAVGAPGVAAAGRVKGDSVRGGDKGENGALSATVDPERVSGGVGGLGLKGVLIPPPLLSAHQVWPKLPPPRFVDQGCRFPARPAAH